MKVTTKKIQNKLYFFLDGELDQSVAEQIRNEMDNCINVNKPLSVIFNMNKLNFMDSTGIGLILGRYKKLKKERISLYIENPNLQIDKVLKISGIYNIIPILR